MSAFKTTVDIANRALQLLGLQRIQTFDDNAKAADEIRSCYDQLRETEQRRNVWRFSIRKAVLYPVSSTSRIFTPTAWANSTTYQPGSLVTNHEVIWASTSASNLANEPGLVSAVGPQGQALWEEYFGSVIVEAWALPTVTTAYYAGDLVYTGAGFYRSLTNRNVDDPDAATGAWRMLAGQYAAFSILYPLGAGPNADPTTRNVFVLPGGFLRQAPQDPKAGAVSFLGASSARRYDDWELENNFLISTDPSPIVFRFAAAVRDVTQFDPMFCEGLACRVALETCESLTQSSTKVAEIDKLYRRIMLEARTVNGIETGPVEPPEDDWITCRL